MSLNKSKLIYSILIIFIIANISYSQSAWTLQYQGGSNDYLGTIAFVNSDIGFCSMEFGKLLRTGNGGTNWIMQPIDSNYYFSQFVFLSETECLGLFNSGGIAKTTNGGLNWHTVFSYNSLNHIFAVDAQMIYVSGDQGVLYKSTDGGTTWQWKSTGSSYNFVSLYFSNASNGFLISDYYGIMAKTTNGGDNFSFITFVNLGPNISLQTMDFINQNIGYIVANGGIILKSTNTGLNWNTLVTADTSSNYYSLDFVTENTGYVMDVDHSIPEPRIRLMKTTNGGVNWIQIRADSIAIGGNDYFIDANTGYYVTRRNIYKTTTGGVIGITPIGQEIPKAFSLHQNYPNPFNPSTTILFDLPKNSQVKITLYDVLGSVVGVIANEYKSAGSYKLNYDASSLASGIYFYRIEAGEFSDSKKMVLVK